MLPRLIRLVAAFHSFVSELHGKLADGFDMAADLLDPSGGYDLPANYSLLAGDHD